MAKTSKLEFSCVADAQYVCDNYFLYSDADYDAAIAYIANN